MTSLGCIISYFFCFYCYCIILLCMSNKAPPLTVYEEFLLFARRSEIRGVDMVKGEFNVMPALTLPNVHSPQALDYDVTNNRLYWTDGDIRLGHLGIISARLNGTDYQTIIDSGEWLSKGVLECFM